MQFEEIKSLVEETFPNAIVGEDLSATPHALIISKDSVRDVCAFLHEKKQTYFDSLSCLTGLDNGQEAGTMEIIYNLYSIPYDHHLMLKVFIGRENDEVDSVSDIWRTADWLEREVYDLLGIRFKNHPDLRRILLPNDWEGHPLRKDYQEQEKYHEVKVKY